ncbi:major facilitator transporter [Caballeronia calidae]|uniref:Major facilitator transporter n=1 Tax=Caballeronia calidae TaxID=1777139 RepID=A0A158E7V7_9BURK|nr:MFS transporter [Caballeronia calidae]SAL02952.1 major facilitator transporter [Caballeronia calidae]
MKSMRIDQNVLRLSMAQAFAGANSAVVYATGAIIGNELAPSPSLATMPISIFVAGMAMATIPAGIIARRYGRRVAFMTGNACGVAVGLLAAAGILLASFWLFCVGMLFGGAYAAIVLTFRFAVADCVPLEKRARALSTVMVGGVLAGVLGPQLANITMNLWPPHAFAVTYIAAAVVAALSAVVLRGVKFSFHTPEVVTGGRTLSEILCQPRLLTAMLSGMVSYMMMNFLMTSAPLAMDLCGITRAASNMGIQWHIVAMYAPSFFTGRLISRFGAPRIVLSGLAFIALAAFAGLSGLDVAHFWTSLILLGIGWNFGFLGSSALVLECHSPEERTRVQSVNDFVVFGSLVIGSFASGGLLSTHGWVAVCIVAFFPVATAALAIALLPAWRVRGAQSA